MRRDVCASNGERSASHSIIASRDGVQWLLRSITAIRGRAWCPHDSMVILVLPFRKQADVEKMSSRLADDIAKRKRLERANRVRYLNDREFADGRTACKKELSFGDCWTTRGINVNPFHCIILGCFIHTGNYRSHARSLINQS